MVRRTALALLLAGAVAPAAGARAAAECRLALVMGMDVSASVDAGEYRLMMDGTAAALMAPAVQAAVLDGPPVAMAAFVWAGAREQAVAADWALIADRAGLRAFAARIAGFARPQGDPMGAWSGRTAVGAALLAARTLLDRAPRCDAQTVDLAGDGINNDGVAPGPLRATHFAGVTINALAVSGDLPLDHGLPADEGGQLSAWFSDNVLHGPTAFVESAEDYRDFQRAMTRKLLRELRPPMLGRAGLD